MKRAIDFAWPLRWPFTMLLLAGNMTRLVPQDSRDAYQLVAVGLVLLLALRLFFLDHEQREDRKAAERDEREDRRHQEREDRLGAWDRGMEALEKTLKDAGAALATEQEALSKRLGAMESWQTGADDKLQRMWDSPIAQGARLGRK